MKPQSTVKTQPEVAVEGDQHREPAAGAGIRQPEAMVAGRIGNDNVAPILTLPIGGDR